MSATELRNLQEETMINASKSLNIKRSTEKMRWDTATIDKLLYVVNSIVLLVCGVVLMFFIKPLDAPYKSIKCWTPQEFRTEWNQYAEKQCLSPNASLFGISDDDDLTNRTLIEQLRITQDEIFPARPSNSDFTTSLILMSILSLLPIICWRLVGSIDGRDFLTKGDSSTQNGFIIMLWFLITKVGTAALCALFVVLIIGMKGQGEEYLDVADYNGQPEDRAVLCEFGVRKLGNNIRKYAIQCVISKRQDGVSSLFSAEHILGPMLKSLQIWLIILLVVNVINLLATAIFVLFFISKSSRLNFIRRYLPDGTDTAACDKLDRRLGVAGAIVFNLAVRLGYGKEVKNALAELCSHQN